LLKIKKIIRFVLNNIKSHENDVIDIILIDPSYYISLKRNKKLILCIDAGRSGTRWLSDIFNAHKNAVGSCERNAFAEAFYRYIKWNKLPIDTQGIVELTKHYIIKDWQKADISMISAFFHYDLADLCDELKVDKVIWAVNDARFTVTSFYNKGWYKNENMRKNDNLINGFQPKFNNVLNRSFTRLVPVGDFYNEWKKSTRIGKISWFWNTVNMEIYSNIKNMPEEKVWVFKLEEADQNYDYYLKIAEEFELKPVLSQRKFLSLKWKSVKKTDNIRKEWTEQEEKEFEKYTAVFRQIYKTL